jgi:hypothetical protein
MAPERQHLQIGTPHFAQEGIDQGFTGRRFRAIEGHFTECEVEIRLERVAERCRQWHHEIFPAEVNLKGAGNIRHGLIVGKRHNTLSPRKTVDSP